MIKPFTVLTIRYNSTHASDCDGQPLRPGYETCELELLLDDDDPAGELKSQLDWNGEFSRGTELICAVFNEVGGETFQTVFR